MALGFDVGLIRTHEMKLHSIVDGLKGKWWLMIDEGRKIVNLILLMIYRRKKRNEQASGGEAWMKHETV